jgi:hypothetical protein
MSAPGAAVDRGERRVPLFADSDRSARLVARVPARLEVALGERARLSGRTLIGELRVALSAWLEDDERSS